MSGNPAETFKNSLLATPGFIDEEGVRHHEFKRGNHGRKMDFSVVEKGTPQYDKWVELNKLAIRERHSGEEELFIIGIADGTTQLAFDVVEAMGHYAVGLRTEKLSDNDVRLTQAARLLVQKYIRAAPATVIALEDIGTTGYTSGGVILETRELGVESGEVQNTWQRSSVLDFLVQNHISHTAIIEKEVPSLRPEQCVKFGDCSKGVELIPYGK